MSRGPVPSQLCLLSALPVAEVGTKVRFLGCVLEYSASTGCLTLGHQYPKDTDTTVAVDVNLVLESMNHEATRIGAWLNILGYITAASRSNGNAGPRRRSSKARPPKAHIQALLVWPTGPLDVARYEKTLLDEISDGNEAEVKEESDEKGLGSAREAREGDKNENGASRPTSTLTGRGRVK